MFKSNDFEIEKAQLICKKLEKDNKEIEAEFIGDSKFDLVNIKTGAIKTIIIEL